MVVQGFGRFEAPGSEVGLEKRIMGFDEADCAKKLKAQLLAAAAKCKEAAKQHMVNAERYEAMALGEIEVIARL